MENRERLIEAGWKQGILLSPQDRRLTDGANFEISQDGWLLIVSQTCDLVQGSFENEPCFDDPSKYKECDEIKNQLENQLDNCDGITVTDITIESAASITLEELKSFYDWDYSYMTFRADGEAAARVELPNK